MADPNEDEGAETEDENDKEKNDKRKAQPTLRGFSTEEEGRAALERIQSEPFQVTEVEKKRGTEMPPRLFDLTSLQVDCNKKFGYSADQTLQLIQSLYEKKVTTYPRVDTTFLSDDIYPKCPNILKGIRSLYDELLAPLRGAPLLKRKKVFDSEGNRSPCHHSVRRSSAEFDGHGTQRIRPRSSPLHYRLNPDCKFATTTVLGQAADVSFKTTGKVILEPGWRAVPASAARLMSNADEDEKQTETDKVLPDFVKGESGPHQPDLAEKMTTPPRPYTEATLLRAMETAGKTVEDDELRDALKENGIGRPSTRAAIIEPLSRRQYIRRQRKNILATPDGNGADFAD